MDGQPIETGVWEVDGKPVDAETYHADVSYVSHSALEVFRASAKTYHYQFVLRCMAKATPTPAMLMGTALHTRVLEPDTFDSRYVRVPPCDKRTIEGKATYSRFLDNCGERVKLDSHDMHALHRMAEAISDNPIAAHFIGIGKPELSIRWQDAVTGIPCKARMDRFGLMGGDLTPVIVDLKTAADPSPEAWHRQALNLGYHRQAAWYRAGAVASRLTAITPRFVFVVIGKNEPYEPWVYELDGEHYIHGDIQLNELMQELATCRQIESFDARYASNVVKLKMPAWARKVRDLPDAGDRW